MTRRHGPTDVVRYLEQRQDLILAWEWTETGHQRKVELMTVILELQPEVERSLLFAQAAARGVSLIDFLTGIAVREAHVSPEPGVDWDRVVSAMNESPIFQKYPCRKGYGNVSEYFRSLLRNAQKEEEDARLEALLLEGLAGGADIPLTPEFWKDLKTEARRNTRHGPGRDRNQEAPSIR